MKFVKITLFLALGLMFCFCFPNHSFANNNECGYNFVKEKKPSFQEVNCLITNIAIENEVPPEIAKAVATQENGTWKHFEDNGDTIISPDGGIGIMQITFYDKSDKEYEEKLKNDVAFNIEEGIKRLANNFYKRSDLPKINDHSPEKLESWYFAIMAYNGIKPTNSPFIKYDNQGVRRNNKAYQELVYAKLESDQEGFGFKTNVSLLPFKAEDFQYDEGSNDNIQFLKLQYNFNIDLTNSKEMSTINDYVRATLTTSIRKEPSTSSQQVKRIDNHSILKVTEELDYDRESIRNRFGWYPVSSSNSSGYTASKYLEKVGARLGGGHRYSTAVEISKRGWEKADTVILARGDDFPDALAGAPLAYQLDGPILLTEPNKLTPSTKNEINRLGAKKVIILGSSKAVSMEVENEIIRNLKLDVDRISGSGRYETAVNIAKRLNGNPKKAILAYGKNFPDALAIAPYAAMNGYPILLTEKDNIPAVVKAELSGKSQTILVGGSTVISPKVEEEVKNPLRLSGSGRYATAVDVMNKLNMDKEKVFFSNGFSFADALTGSVLAAKYNAPLLLVEQENIPSVTSSAINNRMEEFYLLGSTVVVEESLVPSFSKLIR